jgi:nucleoid-associated protein YgaU
VVFKGSRYTNTDVIAPQRADGKSPRVLARRQIPPAPGVVEHVATDGERLDLLATRFYNESTKYWLILDANPEVLNPFELLLAGRTVQIPQNRIVTQ